MPKAKIQVARTDVPGLEKVFNPKDPQRFLRPDLLSVLRDAQTGKLSVSSYPELVNSLSLSVRAVRVSTSA